MRFQRIKNDDSHGSELRFGESFVSGRRTGNDNYILFVCSLRRSQTSFISIQIKRYYDATASYLESSDFKSQLRGRPSLPRFPVIFLGSSKQNITPVYDTIVSFHVLPNSLLSNHPTLPRHNLCCCHWQ